MSNSSTVIVIGGGWAGLSTAVELSRQNIPVTLFESAKQVGGRARRVPFKDSRLEAGKQDDANPADTPSNNHHSAIAVDNGQHLLLGAYEATLSMLRTVGLEEEHILSRQRLNLAMHNPNLRRVKLKLGQFPAPYHLVLGLLLCSGLSIKERISALKFSYAMSRIDFSLPEDESCLALLKRFNQSTKLIKTLWEPICLAGLNTPLDEASAIVYLRMLRESFSYTNTDSNMLLTSTDLGSTFPDPAMDYIERNGGSVRLGQRVHEITIEDNAVRSVSTENDTIEADHVVIATPHHSAIKLLSQHSQFSQTCSQLRKLKHKPICTIYLKYPSHVRLGGDMIGLVGTTAQWAFDRSICGQPGLIAVVISSDGEHMKLNNEDLSNLIELELSRQFPIWPKAEQSMVIREKRATFSSCVGVNLIRPSNKTPVSGLWLAGDYTNTELPATLESAVRSGLRSAHAIVEQLANQSDRGTVT